MRVGIIHFEDFGTAARLFYNKWLVPKFQELGGNVIFSDGKSGHQPSHESWLVPQNVHLRNDIQIDWLFVSYIKDPKIHDLRNEQEVIDEAYKHIRKNNIDRLVFITDLDARGGETFEVEYGGNVLYGLSLKISEDQEHPPYIVSFEDMLESNQLLVIPLTLVPNLIDKALSVIPEIVPSNIHKVLRNHKYKLKKNVDEAMKMVLAQYPKMVLAGRGDDEAWIASLIIEWIKYYV